MSRCKVKRLTVLPRRFAPWLCLQDFHAYKPFPMAKGQFPWAERESASQHGAFQMDKPKGTDNPAQNPLVRCLQVMPLPTDWPASHHPFWRPKPIPLMQNSISHDALCVHLVLKTCDTTVWVISSDSGMLKMKLRNFSIIFSLSIFLMCIGHLVRLA